MHASPPPDARHCIHNLSMKQHAPVPIYFPKRCFACPGGILREEVAAMDAQTVIALCAILMLVAEIFGLNRLK